LPAPRDIPPPLPRALLLDLDDTILDDSGTALACWREACEAHAAGLGAVAPEEALAAIQRMRAWYWSDRERHRVGRLDLGAARAEVVRLALAELGVGSPAVANAIAADYGARRDAGIMPLEGAVETVRWLRERGCRLALVTNGNAAAQRSKVDRFDLAPLFDAILIEGELGFGKPDPRVYRRALDALDTAPEDAWMVGDNLEWEVASPQRLGIFSIWVDRRGTGLPEGHPVRPDRVVRRLAELRDS
jgi:HAD superfamily hydrolase (TIGR01509 family)